jgi:putative ABC transport system permease protein
MRDWNDVRDEAGDHIAELRRSMTLRGHSTEEIERAVEIEMNRIAALKAAVQPFDSADPAYGKLRFGTGLGRDMVHAVRLLAAKRGYSSIVVLTLAVGIGGCAAVFSLFNSLLLRPLAFPDPERLVLIWETTANDSSNQFSVSAPNYRDFATARSFKTIGLFAGVTFNLSADAEPQQVNGTRASASAFEALGVRPALGRVFTTAEDEPGHQVAVISDGVWKTHFGGSPDVVGRQMRLNGKPYEVIGVMPPDFALPRPGIGVYVPVAHTREEQGRDWHSFLVVARLADDVSFEQARDEIERLGVVLRERHTENRNEGATIERLSSFGLENTQRILTVLAGAVGLVLLIACVNVASLQLAFGLSRQREFATRLSLGARYSVLVRQVLIEALAMAALGCLAGLAIAFAVTRGVDAVLAPGFLMLPFRANAVVGVDMRVVAFAALVSVTAALIFAFAPLHGLRRGTLQGALRSGDRSATRLAAGTRRALVTVEIALAIIVLSGAGLMVRSLGKVLGEEPGLDPTNVLVMRASLPQEDAFGAPVRRTFCSDLAREAAAVPGLLRATAIDHLPLAGSNSDRIVTLEGRPAPPPGELTVLDYRVACPGYFATLGITLRAGRDFNEHDVVDATLVTIINRAAAEELWPGEDPIGKRLKFGRFDSKAPWLTIVGVAENVHHFALEAAPRGEMFRPYSQVASSVMTIVAKTAGDPMTWQGPMRAAMKRVDAQVPVSNVRSMEDVVRASVAWRESPMHLLIGFASLGLLLAAIGVYGVLAYYVSQRRREFGVRLALGASKPTLVGLVLKQTAIPVAVGLGLGVIGSLASGRLLAGLLYEVEPGDPIILATIAALLVAVALISSWVPARNAASVDPLVALREA